MSDVRCYLASDIRLRIYLASSIRIYDLTSDIRHLASRLGLLRFPLCDVFFEIRGVGLGFFAQHHRFLTKNNCFSRLALSSKYSGLQGQTLISLSDLD